MLRFFVLALCICLCIPQGPASAKSVQSEFMDAWQDRDARYQKAYSSGSTDANAAIQKFTDAIGQQDKPDVVKELFADAMDRVHVASESRGRGMTVHAFISFIEHKPSAARSEVWMQEQVDALKQEQAQLQFLSGKVKDASTSHDLRQIIESTQNWVQAHGEMVGRSDELTLIDQNLRSYYAAKGKERAQRSESWRAILAGIGAALERNANETSTAMPFPVRTNCRTFGGVTNCQTQ